MLEGRRHIATREKILAELRDVSQLTIVTHQKQTMEVADAL
jgi:chromosome segregation ATPase